MHSETTFTFGWEVGAFARDDHVVLSENFLLLFCLLFISLILQHLVGHVWKIKYFPESLSTILLTTFVGGCIRLVVDNKKGFSPLIIGFSSEVFYFGLLPPIIFNSGYYLRRRLLYGNLGAVLILAFFGTMLCTALSTVAITILLNILTDTPDMTLMETIAFSCVIASTDPVATLAVFSRLRVDPALYYAVLGESVLNDAVAITAFRVTTRMISATTMSSMNMIACGINFVIIVVGSSVIGYAIAVLVACVLRHLQFDDVKVVPVGVVLCAVYIPFFLAEMLQLSGIVTIFFSGIAARRYIHKNLTEDVRKISAFVFHLLAHVSETTCFVLLGLSVFLVDLPRNQWMFMFSVLGVALLSRPLVVYPLLTILNLFRNYMHPPIAYKDAHASRSFQKSNNYSAIDIVDESNSTRQLIDSALERAESGVEDVSDLSDAATVASDDYGSAGASPGDSAYCTGKGTCTCTSAPTQTPVEEAPLPLTEPLSSANIHVIAFAGMRGAVSFSLAYIFPNDHGNRDFVLCTTILVVLVTSFVQGCLTEPLIKHLGVRTGVDYSVYMKKRSVPAGKSHSIEQRLLYPYIIKPRVKNQPNNHSLPGFQPQVKTTAMNSTSNTVSIVKNTHTLICKSSADLVGVGASVAISTELSTISASYPDIEENPDQDGSSTLQLQRWFSLRAAHHGDETMSSGGGSLISCDERPSRDLPRHAVSLTNINVHCIAKKRRINIGRHRRASSMDDVPQFSPFMDRIDEKVPPQSTLPCHVNTKNELCLQLSGGMSQRQISFVPSSKPLSPLALADTTTLSPRALSSGNSHGRNSNNLILELQQVLAERGSAAFSPGGTYCSPVYANDNALYMRNAPVFNHLPARNPYSEVMEQKLDELENK